MFASAKHLFFSIVYIISKYSEPCTQGIMDNISYFIIYLFAFCCYCYSYSRCCFCMRASVYVIVSCSPTCFRLFRALFMCLFRTVLLQFVKVHFQLTRFIYLNCFCLHIFSHFCSLPLTLRLFIVCFCCCFFQFMLSFSSFISFFCCCLRRRRRLSLLLYL